MEDNGNGADHKSDPDNTTTKGGQPVNPEATVPTLQRPTENLPVTHSDTEDPAEHQVKSQRTMSTEDKKREIARNVVESQRLSTPHRLRDRGSFRNRLFGNSVGHRGQQQRNLAMTDHLAELPLGD
jgi:hypothetical protein